MPASSIRKKNGSVTVTGADSKIVTNLPSVTAPSPTAPTLAAPTPDREARLAAAEDALVNAVQGIQTSQEFMAALEFAARRHRYSFSNTLLMYGEHQRRRELDPDLPEDPGVFMSYQAWQDSDRQVRKGEKGYPVLVPMKASGRFYTNAVGERVFLKKGEKAPTGVVVERASGRVVGFRVGSTFAEYQTDGEPLPKPPTPRLLEDGEIEGLTDSTERLVRENGFEVELVPASQLGGANGVMIPDEKKIMIRDDVSPAQLQKTLLHETAHMLLHAGDDFQYDGKHRGFAETEAESVAYMVTSILGGDTSEYSVPYVATWSTGMSASELRKTINSVGSTANRIVDALGVGDPVSGE